jgi:hypothetical protein
MAGKQSVTYGNGTEADPWLLKTPSLTFEYKAWRDPGLKPPALVIQVGATKLSYQLRSVEDLHSMLKKRGDWVPLGNADEGKPVQSGTVGAWARDATNLVGGYYGLRKGYRGRFANYVAPLLEILGLAELEHGARNSRIRAV